ISRNTLREVFRLLTQEGLLRYQPNRGVCVAVPTDADIIDIYRIRRLIECDALRNAYPYHPAITMMERAVNEARRALREENWGEVDTANMQFHAAIVALSD
ncbi:GntR family transcriptional regulator, partial [Klebsiella pneumoniae]|uniref:GntR family transcriptional regulator n=1 Tax=Klebsiella pneumoniae TaxID=573 RepID=UPI00115EC464